MRQIPASVRPLSALALAVSLGGIAAAQAGGDVTISQKNKQFQPGSVSLAQGQAIEVLNDDQATIHHAYVESDHFNFDSGDQKPGSRTRIVFPIKGDYQVLCGIHPAMKLDVHVR